MLSVIDISIAVMIGILGASAILVLVSTTESFVTWYIKKVTEMTKKISKDSENLFKDLM